MNIDDKSPKEQHVEEKIDGIVHHIVSQQTDGDELPVLKYSNGWVYTQIFDTTGRKSEGWLSPRNQCDNPYTTCN